MSSSISSSQQTRVAPLPWTRYQLVCLLAAALLHLCICIHGSLIHSPSWDEVGHLAAGLEHWQHGTFELYKVNPPLPRALAVIPLLASTPDVPARRNIEFPERGEWEAGRSVIESAGTQIFTQFTRARWMLLPFSLLGLAVCVAWARALGGNWAGVCAAWLWGVEPNVVTGAQLLAPDLCAAAVGIMLFWQLRHWLLEPNWKRCLTLSVWLGIALLCKTSWVLALPLIPALWLWWRILGRQQLPKSELFQIGAVVGIALLVVNAGYLFSETMQPLGGFQFFSQPLRGAGVTPGGFAAGNRFRGTLLQRVPCPLPASFVEGIDFQISEFERGYTSYLLGEYKHGGWPHFYVLTLLWKVPLGFWMLMMIGTSEFIARSLRTPIPLSHSARSPLTGTFLQEAGLLFIPVLTLLVTVSSQTGFSHHLRYVLPIFPFGFILAAQAVAMRERTGWLRRGLTALALTWGLTSSLAVTPHQLSYFNELVGGPSRGYFAAGLGGMDSLHDWQQDLLLLTRWQDKHPDTQLDGIAVRSFPGLRDAAGLTPRTPPPGEIDSPDRDDDSTNCRQGPQPGWYALSLKDIHLPDSPYTYFSHLKPVDRVGYTIMIFHVTTADADRAWRKLHGENSIRPDCGDASTAPQHD